VVKVGQSLSIDGRGSYALDGPLVKYEWDFNGDGIYDQTTTTGLVEHTFSQEFDGVMGLRVTDSAGRTGVGSTLLVVSNDGDVIPREVDNCPDVDNYGQGDQDGDDIGDACDPDFTWPTEGKPGVYEITDPPDPGDSSPNNPGGSSPGSSDGSSDGSDTSPTPGLGDASGSNTPGNDTDASGGSGHSPGGSPPLLTGPQAVMTTGFALLAIGASGILLVLYKRRKQKYPTRR
jgi:hypothetical protein